MELRQSHFSCPTPPQKSHQGCSSVLRMLWGVCVCGGGVFLTARRSQIQVMLLLLVSKVKGSHKRDEENFPDQDHTPALALASVPSSRL